MSVTTAAAVAPVKPLIAGGLAAAVTASAATAAIAGLGEFAGVSLDVSGEPIPVVGFAVMTMVFSGVGLLLALVLARSAHRARTVFVRTTMALTALSLVPDALADASTSTKMLLMLTHLIAAAIVIPTITRRLSA